jgi:hypothetical protein
MLVGDAIHMIAQNERGLAALRKIVARMADKPDISSHEGIVEMQKEPGRFGPAFYYAGARDAELSEALSHARPILRRQVKEVELRLAREFEAACDETINRHFRRGV